MNVPAPVNGLILIIVVLPAGIADEVAEQAAEQERLESFVLQRIAAGAPLPGTYPPDSDTLAAYTAWRTQHG